MQDQDNTAKCESPMAYSGPRRGNNEYHRAFHSIRTLVESVALPKVKHTEYERELDALLCACESATHLGQSLDRTFDRLHTAEMQAKKLDHQLQNMQKKHFELVQAFLDPDMEEEKLRGMFNIFLGFAPDFDIDAHREKAKKERKTKAPRKAPVNSAQGDMQDKAPAPAGSAAGTPVGAVGGLI